ALRAHHVHRRARGPAAPGHQGRSRTSRARPVARTAAGRRQGRREALSMTGDLDFLVAWSSYVALAALAVALIMVFVRLLIGPSLPDRIVALDTIAYLSIGFCAVWAVHAGHDAFLDA